jgi:hypothetical protein
MNRLIYDSVKSDMYRFTEKTGMYEKRKALEPEELSFNPR